MKQRSERTIAIAFDLNFSHAAEVFRGVSEHRSRNGLSWRLLPLNYGFESTLMGLAKQQAVDGVIGTFISERWLSRLLEQSLPVVNVFNFARIRTLPSVTADDLAIGREAARHLREQGANRYGFLGEGRVQQSRLRHKGYVEEVAATVHELSRGPALGEQLLRLARGSQPAGLFCSNDRLAREATVEAATHGLRIGKDLLTIGVGNDPAESIYASMGLSSFALPARAVGAEAARLLADLLAGEDVPPGVRTIGPPRLIARESSMVGGRARLARRALALLQERFSDPEFCVDEMAQTVGASRRSLESALREHGGDSPYQLLCARRLEHACELLQKTDVPVGRIGERCGFSGHHHFSAWFRKQTGLPPREYRKRQRVP